VLAVVSFAAEIHLTMVRETGGKVNHEQVDSWPAVGPAADCHAELRPQDSGALQNAQRLSRARLAPG
jgi:hypothetical protein